MVDRDTDTAGPLMGWSLGTGMERRELATLVDFPCNYTFKAVGEDDEGFVPDLLGRVAGVLGRSIEDHETKVRQSAKGRYASVTLDLWVTDGEMLYSIYEAIYDDDRVRYLL